MRLFLLTSLTMVAFAANSVLNRLSLAEGEIGPSGFALIRVVSGALVLLVLVAATRKSAAKVAFKPASAIALTVYLLGFSFAYVSLETGIGALILFGGVQITMFAGALIARDEITPQRWVGSALAVAGLVWLLLPSAGAPPVLGAALMAAAAIGWGVYSLIGRTAALPLLETQRSFLLAVPLVTAAWVLVPDGVSLTSIGVVLAVLSGAVTSGLGYALWYSVLPKLDTISASVAQLTVPVIAMLGGVAFLGEPLTWRFAVSTALILSGVLIAVRR